MRGQTFGIRSVDPLANKTSSSDSNTCITRGTTAAAKKTADSSSVVVGMRSVVPKKELNHLSLKSRQSLQNSLMFCWSELFSTRRSKPPRLVAASGDGDVVLKW